MSEKKETFKEKFKRIRKERLAKQFHGDYLSESDRFVKSYERGAALEDSVIRDYRPTEKYKGKIKNYAQPRKSNHEEGVQRSLRDLKLYGKFREIGEKEA